MKKTVIIFLILVLISSALSAEDTGGSTTGPHPILLLH